MGVISLNFSRHMMSFESCEEFLMLVSTISVLLFLVVERGRGLQGYLDGVQSASDGVGCLIFLGVYTD